MKMDQTPLYSIGTVARMLEVSVYTLRMYEREGLVIPRRAESNQRLYSQSDVDRLKCIRTAITELKFSIPAIKTIYSLIPCWDIVKCSESDRSNCAAYSGHSLPCWTYRHKKNTCAERDCRTCTVYTLSADCGSIKQMIQSSRK